MTTETQTPAKALTTLQRFTTRPGEYHVENADRTRRYYITRTESRDWAVEAYALVASGRVLELEGETLDTRTWTAGDKLGTEWESTRTLAVMMAEGWEARLTNRTQDFLAWCAARSA